MKKFICLAIIATLWTSCESADSRRPVASVYNYSNSVIVDKSQQYGDLYLLKVRTKVKGVYSIVTVRVPKGEYVQFAIGDTIK